MNLKPALPLLSVIFLLGASLACSLSGPTPTLTPAPTTTPMPPQGMAVSSAGVSFVIPAGLAGGASTQSTNEVELPFTNPGGGDMPTHAKFTLENYAVAGRTAYIAVFPADGYAAYTDGTAQTVAALKTLPDTLDKLSSPLLQYSFYARARVVPFQNGRGLRYLTQVMQATVPIDNAEMFYWFAGLTSDGKYYISAAFPVGAAFLQSDGGAATLPANGVPFPTAADAAGFDKYYSQVQQKLNAADSNAFTPNLDALDTLVGSIKVVAP